MLTVGTCGNDEFVFTDCVVFVVEVGVGELSDCVLFVFVDDEDTRYTVPEEESDVTLGLLDEVDVCVELVEFDVMVLPDVTGAVFGTVMLDVLLESSA